MYQSFLKEQADSNFSKARGMEVLQRIVHRLAPWKQQLLKLDEVRTALKPEREHHLGIITVPIRKIIGSEGRYNDFSKTFLPKHEYLRGRWTSIDRAHSEHVILPPVHLYEMGGAYFVRDGNHRISVARMLGMEEIDAVVTSLETKITLDENMTSEDLRTKIIFYEQTEFYNTTSFREVSGGYNLLFTTTGRYKEILSMIHAHKECIESDGCEVSISEACQDWFLNLFYPLVRIIQKQKIVSRFPRRTADDLFLWVFRHWEELKRKEAGEPSLETALKEYSSNFGKNILQRLFAYIKSIWTK